MKKAPDDEKTYYPLTHAQKRIYYDEKKHPGTAVGAQAFIVKYQRQLDRRLLEKAVNTVLLKNEGLRLRIVEFDFEPEPSQYVSTYREIPLEIFDFSGPNGKLRLKEWLAATTREPLTLIDGDLFYFACLQLENNETGYYMKMHHIISDGWCYPFIFNEINGFYEAFESGKPVGDEPNPSYIRYIHEEAEYMNSPRAEKDRAFWHKTLLPLPPEVNLSLKSARPDNIEGKVSILVFPDELRTKIHEYCEVHKTSLFKLIITALSVYISKVTGIEDIPIGSVNHNRAEAIRKRIVGMFASTIPVRIKTDGDMIFQRLVEKTGEEINCIVKNHQSYPFDSLATELRELTGVDTGHLLNITLAGHGSVQKECYTFRHIFQGYVPSQITIHIDYSNRDIDGSLELEFEYRVELFSDDDVHRLQQGLINFMHNAFTAPGEKLSGIELLSEDEKKQILFDFNDTRSDYPKDKTIHELFEVQAVKAGDRLAVVGLESSPLHRWESKIHLTYRVLNQKADLLAQVLRKKGVKPGSIVGIMVKRSIEMICGILAILKVGGAYLPIDPQYPEERKRFMMADSSTVLLLTTRASAQEAVKSGTCRDSKICVCIIEDSLNAYPRLRASQPKSKPDGLAYIMYTSGSTGRPKGVMIMHRNVVRLVKNTGYVTLNETTRILQTGAPVFDAVTFEIWGSLLNGGYLLLMDNESILDAHRLAAAVKTHHINTLWLSAQLFNQLLQQNIEIFSSLRYLLVGGDVLSPPHINRVRHRFPGLGIINGYGPTENTTFSTTYSIIRDFESSIPIGRPISNSTAYVVSKHNQLHPIGVPGELWVGGEGVGCGYLNNPVLTAERFIENVFSTQVSRQPGTVKPGQTSPAFPLYKTGDLARWLPDGNIEFLGRIDQQVKIRGYRIEIGEIENRLLSLADIKEAVVVTGEDGAGEKSLCGYITSDETMNLSAVRKSLADHLPRYMIPAYLMQIEKIPLTPNGKIDRKALPNPKGRQSKNGYTAPGNEVEKKLADIWSVILKIEVNTVGIHDNFFESGGHSLKAAVMIAKVHKELNVKVAMADIFKMPTIRLLADYIEGVKEEYYAAVEPAEKREYYPQSSAQKRLYVLQKMDKTSTSYNIMRLEMPKTVIPKEELERIFKILIRRHESFRTSFFMKDGAAVQKIHDKVSFAVEYYETMEGRTPDGERRSSTGDGIWKHGERRENIIDRRGKRKEERPGPKNSRPSDVPAQEIIRGFVRPFDLSEAPLLRVGVITIRGVRQILMMDIHHIIADGISIEELEREFRALVTGQSPPVLKLQYKDFSQWQNSEREKKVLKKEEAYWLNEFETEPPLLNLPADFSRPPVRSFDGDTLNFGIDKKKKQELKAVAHSDGVTLYMILLAAYNVLLAKLSGQEVIVVGTVTAGRKHADFQNIIGMFANTLVLRNFPTGEKTFKEFLADVKERTIAAFENEDYQFEDLVSKVATRHDTSRHPLFDVSFGFWDRTDETGAFGEMTGDGEPKPYSFEVDTAKFDMTLIGVEIPKGLHFSLEYNSRLFKESTIRRLIKYFKKIVESIPRDYRLKISEMDIIPGEEKKRLLFDFNDTATSYPANKTIHQLFEDQAERAPDTIALIGCTQVAMHGPADPADGGGAVSVTYRELNERANQWARFLGAKGVRHGAVVGILIGTSVEMAVGMLGILKTGSGYLPLDPNSPDNRIAYILRESGTRYVLKGDCRYGAAPEDCPAALFSLTGEPEVSRFNRKNLTPPTSVPSDVSYIIYTSGTTGRPKGVAVEHSGLVNYIRWRLNAYRYTPDDVSLQLLSYVFDGFASNFYSSLLSGGKLVLVPDALKMDIRYIKETVQGETVTNFSVVPGLYEALIDAAEAEELRTLRFVVLGGEKAGTHLIERSRLKNPDLVHIIEYGPTEATVAATANIGISEKDTALIGKPVGNTQIYILNGSLSLVPIGVPGEIFIAGTGVARGYLNRIQLTAEKFIKPPPVIPPQHKPTLYRTGDLARWLEDGNIEFLGRLDNQVKIRGYRIELGEIENQLTEIDIIKEAVVVYFEKAAGEKFLCAYYVAESKTGSRELAETLSQRLPDYMIPAHFIELERIPLTPNGKLNRAALPDPKGLSPDREFEAPRDREETLLAEIWRQVLGIDKVGVRDDFFYLGGDSIKAIQIISRLQKYKMKLELNHLFHHRTIKQLKRYLEPIDVKQKANQDSVEGPVELTPIQRWFFERRFSDKHHFNQSVMLHRRKGFDESLARKVFAAIISHHDALRMIYDITGDDVLQVGRRIEGALFDLEVITLKPGDDIDAGIMPIAERLQKSIDLKTGPLVKLGLFKGNDGDRLLIVIHHLVVDGISWRILLEDFETGYRRAERGKTVTFQDKTDSFQLWARKQVEYAGSKRLLEQIPYWKTIEETDVGKLPVDFDVDRRERTHGNMDTVTMTFSPADTVKLLRRVNRVYNTEINDILLTALGLAVQAWAGIDSVLLNLEGHGRERIVEHMNIHRTVGWFTSQYPVILDMRNAWDLSYSIKTAKETLRRVPDKGVGHGILKYITPADKKKSLCFVLEPEIAFNYLGQFDRRKHAVADEVSGISDPRTGESISPDFDHPYRLNINGMVSGGVLSISFSYDKHTYRGESVQKLVESYKTKLLQIVEHCCAKKKREFTPSDLGYKKISLDTLKKISEGLKQWINKEAEIKSIYPLTPMQKQMFFSTLRNKESYFVQNVLAIPAQRSTRLLKKCINILVQRYDAARTVFLLPDEGDVLQVVLNKRDLEIEFIDVSHLSSENKLVALEAYKEKDRIMGFDLTAGPLMRFALVKTGESTDKIVWSQHHISMDGWCMPIVLDELRFIYGSLKSRQPLNLEPPLLFRTYVDWLEYRDKEEGTAYWRKFLNGYRYHSNLSMLGSPVEGGRFEADDYIFTLNETLTDGLARTAADNQVTLNSLFQTLWGILLQRYTGSNDVLFGAVVSGRHPAIEGIERMVGMFINIIPVRVKLKEIPRLQELLKEIQQQSVRSKPHETLPLNELLTDASLPLESIDTVMFFENYPGHGGIDMRFNMQVEESYEQISYNFSFYAVPRKELLVRFGFNSLVFDREFIKRIALDFKELAALAVEKLS